MQASLTASSSASAACTLLKVHARKGRALLKLGNYPAAHLAFQDVLDSPRLGAGLFEAADRAQGGGDGEAGESPAMLKAEEDAARADVRAGVKQVLLAKVMYNRLQMLQSQSDYKQFAATADDLLKVSPEYRSAQHFKVQALCKLHQWKAAKAFAEESVCGKPVAHQRLTAHAAAQFPVASQANLTWKYGQGNWTIGLKNADFIAGVSNAILVMGAEMAQTYVWALKNEGHSRYLCAETMELIKNILQSVRAVVGTDRDWAWVGDQLVLLEKLIRLKNDADGKFRENNFVEALSTYRDFIKVGLQHSGRLAVLPNKLLLFFLIALQLDPTAHVWNAVMYGNRAAALMRLEMYTEAVADCHQSLARDPDYLRAYLRRARAYKVSAYSRAMKSSVPSDVTCLLFCNVSRRCKTTKRPSATTSDT